MPAEPRIQLLTPPAEPALRWRSRVRDLPSIERELARIWSGTRLTTTVDGVEERRIAARTSVMNLVVIAGRPEVGERCASVIGRLTGRHPSRTLIISPADPDGPSWIDAEVQAHCIPPREGAAETCSERIFVRAGGEGGRHLAAIVAPLLIHDLPVTVWWPGDIPFGSDPVRQLLELSDRIVVDGSSWSGDGLDRLRRMSGLLDEPNLAVSDFALIRQSRWREAIASTFDQPDLQPFLRSLRSIEITYATGVDGGRPGPANLVKPLYHAAWLASRLGLKVRRPLSAHVPGTSAEGAGDARTDGLSGILALGRGRIDLSLRPEISAMPRGTTLKVELESVRRNSRLRVAVTAQAETVIVDAWQDGRLLRHRPFLAPRRTEVDMLAEVIESIGRNRLSAEAIRMAVALLGAAA